MHSLYYFMLKLSGQTSPPPPPTMLPPQATYFNGKVIEVTLPKQMVLEVVETDPGEKGNTAQGATKVQYRRPRAGRQAPGRQANMEAGRGTGRQAGKQDGVNFPLHERAKPAIMIRVIFRGMVF